MRNEKYPEVFTCKRDIVEIQNARAKCHDQVQELPTKSWAVYQGDEVRQQGGGQRPSGRVESHQATRLTSSSPAFSPPRPPLLSSPPSPHPPPHWQDPWEIATGPGGRCPRSTRGWRAPHQASRLPSPCPKTSRCRSTTPPPRKSRAGTPCSSSSPTRSSGRAGSREPTIQKEQWLVDHPRRPGWQWLTLGPMSTSRRLCSPSAVQDILARRRRLESEVGPKPLLLIAIQAIEDWRLDPDFSFGDRQTWLSTNVGRT